MPADSLWAGAQSIVHELHVDGDRLRMPFHRNLDAVLPAVAVTGVHELDCTQAQRLAFDAPATLTLSDSTHVVEVRLTADRAQVIVDGTTLVDAECLGARSVDLVIDAEWLEFVCDGVEGMFAARIPSLATASVRCS